MEVTSYILMLLTIFDFVEKFMEENCGSQKDWPFMSRSEHNIFISYGSSVTGRVKPLLYLVTFGGYLHFKTKTWLKMLQSSR